MEDNNFYKTIDLLYVDFIKIHWKTVIALLIVNMILFPTIQIIQPKLLTAIFENLSKITSKTKAICVVHLGGWPAEMKPIVSLSKAYNLYLIEDCSQAHGAKLFDKSVGSFGEVSTWSFCRDKIISTGGEGGMIATSNKVLNDKIWSLKDHGKDFNKYYSEEENYEFKYIHDSLGNNF